MIALSTPRIPPVDRSAPRLVQAKDKPRPAGPPPYRPAPKPPAAPAKKGPSTPAAYRPQTPPPAPKRG